MLWECSERLTEDWQEIVTQLLKPQSRAVYWVQATTSNRMPCIPRVLIFRLPSRSGYDIFILLLYRVVFSRSVLEDQWDFTCALLVKNKIRKWTALGWSFDDYTLLLHHTVMEELKTVALARSALTRVGSGLKGPRHDTGETKWYEYIGAVSNFQNGTSHHAHWLRRLFHSVEQCLSTLLMVVSNNQ